jgi:hypothetical protein
MKMAGNINYYAIPYNLSSQGGTSRTGNQGGASFIGMLNQQEEVFPRSGNSYCFRPFSVGGSIGSIDDFTQVIRTNIALYVPFQFGQSILHATGLFIEKTNLTQFGQ